MNGDGPVLLVEDDAVDVLSLQRAWREVGVASPLEVARDGEEALARLGDATAPRPVLVITDINMPRMNGIELLCALKASPRTRRLPVVVLTTSDDETDRCRCFDQSAAGYMLKPIDYARFVDVVRTIHRYWSESRLCR